jgi:hypothetical protein
VRGELGRVVTEAAEIDELPQPRVRRGACDRLRGAAVALLEVGRAERVDEVVGRIGAGERRADRGRIAGIGDGPRDAVPVRPPATRDGHDLVLPRQHGEELAPDRAGGSEDDDLHGASSPIRRRR